MEYSNYIILTTEEIEKKKSVIIKRLKSLKWLRWSLEVIAQQTKLTPASISRYISGQRNMSLDTLIKLEKALGINITN